MKSLERIALDRLKKEVTFIGIVFLATYGIFQAVFIKENPISVIRTVAGLYWLYILPGYAFMMMFEDKLEAVERLIIGTLAGMAVVGVVGYNLTVIGINMRYHFIILPPAMISLGIFLALQKRKVRRPPEPKREAEQGDQGHKNKDQG